MSVLLGNLTLGKAERVDTRAAKHSTGQGESDERLLHFGCCIGDL